MPAPDNSNPDGTYTPSFGPRAGQVMTQEEYDSYINDQLGGVGPLFPSGGKSGMTPAGGKANANTDYWNRLFLRGPNSVAMPSFQTANQDQARLQQQQVIQELQRQAAGDPNSQAQQQLQQGYGAAQAQQASLGSTMRGQSAGAAMRGVQAGQQGIQRGLAGDQQMLQAQEQQVAQQMLAQLLAQQQGQDTSQATSMAQGQLQGDALNRAMQQFYDEMGGKLNLEQAQIGVERNNAQNNLALEQGDTVSRLGGKLLSAGATALSTYGQQDNRTTSQKAIDDAFDNG